MIVKLKILAGLVSLSMALTSFNEGRLVYIEGTKNSEGVVFNSKTSQVNLFIDAKLVADTKVKQGIKLYLAYQLLRNKVPVANALKKLYKTDAAHFGSLHRQQISNVIYYLEHEDHGNLPAIYKSDAYGLLELKELKPEINAVRRKLYKKGMIQIDVPGKMEDMQELKPTGKPDTTGKH